MSAPSREPARPTERRTPVPTITHVARDPERADAALRKHFAIGDEYRRRALTGESDSRKIAR